MSPLNLVPVQQLRKLLNRPVGYGTILTMLVATLLMTSLFWKSQTPEIQVYTEAINNLVELKYFDMRMERELEAVRQFGMPDLQNFRSAITVLRDLGQEYGSLSLENGASSGSIDSLSIQLERQLFTRIGLAERLMSSRILMRAHVDSLQSAWTLQLSQGQRGVYGKLDTLQRLRAGEVLVPPQDSTEFNQLLVINQRQQAAFQLSRESQVQLLADELIARYRLLSHDLLLSKERVTRAFYILSLLSLIVVMILAARMKK